MVTWMIFVRERFPLLSYGLIIGAMLATAVGLNLGPLNQGSAALAVMGLILFYFTLRLMDEIKDAAKDKIIHPERPLARGLLDTKEAQAALGPLYLAMTIVAFSLGMRGNYGGGIAYSLVGLYLYLMYREFFIGQWLGRYPLLYALSHQLILFPLVIFTHYAVQGPAFELWPSLASGWVSFAGFFCYEIGRKQDPHAHALLGSYRQILGWGGSLAFTIFLLLVGLIGAKSLGRSFALWPSSLLVVLAYIFPWSESKMPKAIEIFASIHLICSLGLCLWSPQH